MAAAAEVTMRRNGRSSMRRFLAGVVVAAAGLAVATAQAADVSPAKGQGWSWPDLGSDGSDFKQPPGKWGELVAYGRELTRHTYAHLGPEVPNPAMRYAGNNLACGNCHLQSGAKQYGLPYVGVYAAFPMYRPREGRVASLEDRINGCMTRSMNGKPLPLGSREMLAMVAWMRYLSNGVPVGRPPKERGGGPLPLLDRAADPAKGAKVYAAFCAACHMPSGQGQRNGKVGDAKGYQFPPLWGPDSFNDGAGMARLINAARFAHSNMPNGTTWDSPTLSAEQAWDVAAYMESQPRPSKANLAKDFPNRAEKPVDAAYGPYDDGFSAEQHKYGPFGPIEAARKARPRNTQ
jgi:thiosulfate dehydrogenase